MYKRFLTFVRNYFNNYRMTFSLRKANRLIVLLVLLFVTLAARADKARFTLVIDAGHGGHDAGAVGSFSKEKNINLNVALAFGHLVEVNCPDVKVIYTRKTDVFIPLQKRADIANSNKADLFISVHTNALPNGRIAYGSETYSLGMARASANLEVAKRENSVIMLENDYKRTYEGFDPNKAESYVIFELMQDRFMKQSVELARCIQLQYASAGRQDKGVHQAGFLVLRNTSMPAVLTELGFISTPAEEQYLNSQRGVEELSRSIYNGFLNYRRKHDKSAHDLPANLPTKVNADQQSTPTASTAAPSSGEMEVVPVKVTPTAQLVAQTSNEKNESPAAEASTSVKVQTEEAAPAATVKAAAAPKQTASSATKTAASKKKTTAEKTKTTEDTKSKTKAADTKTKADTKAKASDSKTKDADNKKKPEPSKTDKSTTKADKSTTKADKSTTKADKSTAKTDKTAAKDKKASATDKASSKSQTAKSKVSYRIQVGAGKKEIATSDAQFKGLSVTRVKEGTMFKYFYGTYTSYASAQQALRTVKAKLPAAYIVAYLNGKSVSVSEARSAEAAK